MCLKTLITVPFERLEPFQLLRLMGVSMPSLQIHIESSDPMIYVHYSTSINELFSLMTFLLYQR